MLGNFRRHYDISVTYNNKQLSSFADLYCSVLFDKDIGVTRYLTKTVTKDEVTFFVQYKIYLYLSHRKFMDDQLCRDSSGTWNCSNNAVILQMPCCQSCCAFHGC